MMYFKKELLVDKFFYRENLALFSFLKDLKIKITFTSSFNIIYFDNVIFRILILPISEISNYVNSNFFKYVQQYPLSSFFLHIIFICDKEDTTQSLDFFKKWSYQKIYIPIHSNNLKKIVLTEFKMLILEIKNDNINSFKNYMEKIRRINYTIFKQPNKRHQLLSYFLKEVRFLTNSNIISSYSIQYKQSLIIISNLYNSPKKVYNKSSFSFYKNDKNDPNRNIFYPLFTNKNILKYRKKKIEHPFLGNIQFYSLILIPVFNKFDEISGIIELISFHFPNDHIPVINWQKHSFHMISNYFNLILEAISINVPKEVIEFSKITKILHSKNNIKKLLFFILNNIKKIISCDAGTIFLLTKENKKVDTLKLKFFVTDIKIKNKKNLYIELDNKSIISYSILKKKIINISDAYKIKSKNYSFNSSYDESNNYKTKSILTIPMINQNNKAIGAIQLINKIDKNFSEPLFIPFSKYDIRLLYCIVDQISMSIQNIILRKNIQKLLNNFVEASVFAIESRDPTTSGHSKRVANYSVQLGKVIENSPHSFYTLKSHQIKELYYGAILHDFGKLFIKEDILTKEKKLFPENLTKIIYRFELLKKNIQINFYKKISNHILNQKDINLKLEKEILNKKIKKIKKLMNRIIYLNENSHIFKPKKATNLLNKLYTLNNIFLHINKKPEPYLTQYEIDCLSCSKGNLTLQEQSIIQEHTTKSFNFISQIPWPNKFKGIANIAYSHHEKLDGSGYPRQLKANQINIQTRIVTICDIFDALIAKDRPYKKAISIQKALNYLLEEAQNQRIDSYLLSKFIEHQIYNLFSKK